jgi:hypothetical protein
MIDKGRKLSMPLADARKLDLGYTSTSHAAQGATVDRVLVNIDSSRSAQLVNDRMCYVAISSARLDARGRAYAGQGTTTRRSRATPPEPHENELLKRAWHGSSASAPAHKLLSHLPFRVGRISDPVPGTRIEGEGAGNDVLCGRKGDADQAHVSIVRRSHGRARPYFVAGSEGLFVRDATVKSSGATDSTRS